VGKNELPQGEPWVMNYFSNDSRTAFEAKCEAQRIAFAPMMFQACRILRDSGILELVQESGTDGVTLEEVAAQAPLPRYGIKVLLESGLGIGLFSLCGDRFVLTKLGYFMLHDPMTRINMDVVHEVCYRGMFDLDKAIQEGSPVGLRSLGTWKTFYEGLASLPPRTRESWLAFDHFYSDLAFPTALPVVFTERPKRLLDLGGNTGKWALECIKYNPQVHVTIADLPRQLQLARESLHLNGSADRITFFPIDVLNGSTSLPENQDAIWMSQFLDCFSEQQIISILQRVALAMEAHTNLFILELFWDRQPNETAAFCLQQTSLYFACIANGNSQMYHSSDLKRCLAEAGLQIIEERDQVGPYHTLFKCRKA
jgi:hypothetical protein